MQSYEKLRPCALLGISPEGWLRAWLQRQRDGLTGHLEAAGSPFDRLDWAGRFTPITYDTEVIKNWWPYEQTGYWADGMTTCAYLLRDEALMQKARRSIDYVLDHPDADGYLGPLRLKEPVQWNRWGHAVFFRALTAFHSATGDGRVIPALERHYLSGTSPHSDTREVCNIEHILWAYDRTGNAALLSHAVEAYAAFCALAPDSPATMQALLSDAPARGHGVSFCEMAKLGALLYLHTGEAEYLRAAEQGYAKLRRDHMLIDGVPSSTEVLRGTTPLDSHETCDIADYTWGLGFLLMATGQAAYADSIERACFNAAPGAVTPDFKALQYFSCPNQVVADGTSNHNLFSCGSQWMSYRPNPGTECCPGSVNRIMPNYGARMWMRSPEGDIVAALYGPGSLRTTAGVEGTEVLIRQSSQYPFEEYVEFTFTLPHPVHFGFQLRLPGWCDAPALSVNGEQEEMASAPGTFFRLERTFQNGDRVRMALPMSTRLIHWPGGAVALERGPLVYALEIAEDWQRDMAEIKCTPDFPAWNLYPASPWNYVLDLREEKLAEEVSVAYHPVTDQPWTQETAPVHLRVPTRRVQDWVLRPQTTVEAERNTHDGPEIYLKEGTFLLTPPLPDPEGLADRLGEREWVWLVPYGCTCLRMTLFPNGQG